MTTDRQIAVLQANVEAVEALVWPFDFDARAAPSNVWSRVEGRRAHPVAADGSGGVFALLDRTALGPVSFVYASSEGQAGLLASNLAEGLAIVVWLPYWRDLLKFSGGGELDEMRRAEPYLVRELAEEQGNILPMQQRLAELLNLTKPDDPIALLHQRVAEGIAGLSFLSDEGEVLDSLFNTFVVQDNPMWRGVPGSAHAGERRHAADGRRGG